MCNFEVVLSLYRSVSTLVCTDPKSKTVIVVIVGYLDIYVDLKVKATA
jgi:hypothetical protein